jgi:hypothetical protein
MNRTPGESTAERYVQVYPKHHAAIVGATGKLTSAMHDDVTHGVLPEQE